jgi:serine/threonine protein kinase/Tfp pilus assembly protein PilF
MMMKCPRCHFENPEKTSFCANCGTKFDVADRGARPGLKDEVSVTKTLETTPDELARGQTFAGRYEIIEELGTGGMGKVYRAFDKQLELEVALKLLKPEIAADKKTIGRFKNELKLARQITHKNVCRMHDLHEEGKTLYITMEYVRGEDLKSLIRRTEKLTVGKAVSIARQIAEGLAEAHKLGVIHRDLKPHNIMIDRDGNAKIMDFGIARTLAGAGTTAQGVIIGTPEYMSPEQVEGKAADQRSDIYALGIIIYEMLTGRVPFEGDTPLSVAYKHKNEIPPSPKKLNPQIPEDLSRLILRCLEKTKERRYQTAEEFLSELAKIEEGLPTAERIAPRIKPTVSKEITVKFTPKKLIIPALAIFAVVAIVIGLWKFLPKKGTRPASTGVSSLAILPFTDLSPEKDQAAWCEGTAEMLLNSLANVKSLQVRGKYSSFLFKAQDDPREVGRKLNAEKLLTGSLQKVGNRLRITVQLIDSADGTPDWSEKFDGQTEEIFDIQDRITSMTVSKMNVGLRGREKERLEKRYTNNQEAYDLYLKGTYVARPYMGQDIKRAIPIYLEAIKKDPDFVLPYVALARCYSSLYVEFGESESKEDVYERSKEALSKVLALDIENGEAFAVRAILKFYFENDPAGAELDFQRAFQLSPKSPFILDAHYWYLVARGRLDEAVSETKLRTEINPLDPGGYTPLGVLYYFLRRYDDAISAYKKALELDPNYLNANGWSFHTYTALGDYEKAREMANLLEHRWREGYILGLAILEALSGKKNEAAKRKEAEKEVFSKPPFEAVYYAVMGDRAQTLTALTRIVDKLPDMPIYFSYLYWHYYDKYRSDPEFTALFKKAGFEFRQSP